jgi:hypothetical protein
MTAFEEFKTTNDARLKEIEKKGGADPLLDEKLGKINTRLDAYEGLSQKLTLVEAQKAALEKLNERFDVVETALKRVGKGVGSDDAKKDRSNLFFKAVYGASTLGVPNLSDEQKAVLTAVADEYKSLSVTTETAGGYLAPVEFVREIIKAETLMSPVRSLVRVRQTAAKSIQIPKRTGQFAAVWVAEQATKSARPPAWPTASRNCRPTRSTLWSTSPTRCSRTRPSTWQAEISMEASEQFAVAEGAAFINGAGVGKPEGILSTSANLSSTNSGRGDHHRRRQRRPTASSGPSTPSSRPTRATPPGA